MKAPSFPMRNARDGDFFRGTFFRVQRVQCDVTHCMAFDLQVLAERLLHKNPVNRKHCEL